ncbi:MULTISPECIES: HlyD family secretion protein [Pedobacter]|uniref:Secretion protein HlyD family protein n=1 Tax=Pedobacter heparinus (strain ATCC 13125 / DSM 2366 / CIP 104194 / JCM 7457 / NBRC 12017 / NCIMB 9290 / NRRL B-14731 / HIM 762-3) TaxID=485917 RepID=C6XXE6_PEDHD|nr:MULTISPECIES: HlyD family secretion protein [Pedobacter]ACU06452.1 secretion protein HlyD family protein [Pedobacter heparinus DSM 2366]MBB5437178.1 membrane fusion protein (multidrug efflux system) [Pedobacter sp. AK017]
MTTEKKKKNKVIPIILGVLIILGAIFGTKEYLYYSKHVDTDDAQIDGDISPVVSRVGGYVQEINFEENTHVTEGQVLVKLDDRDYKLKLEQALAGQKGASAGVGVSESQIAATAANTSTAKANIEAAKVKLNLAQKDYERYANLVKDGSVTQQQFDQAKAQKESAQAAFTAANDQYNAAVKQVGTSQSQLAVSSNTVTQHQADVDFARLQLSYTEIKAPATGIVSKKNVQKGQLVQAGQALFSIVNDNSIYITANFKETQLEDIKTGSKVKIDVDAYPSDEVLGEVYNFAPITGAKGSLLPPDNATGNFVKVVQRVPVKIKITKAPKEILAKLRPGMSVKVSVSIKD